MKLKRIAAGRYETEGGKFGVERVKDRGYPVMWVVTERIVPKRVWSHFDTLGQARRWLEGLY